MIRGRKRRRSLPDASDAAPIRLVELMSLKPAQLLKLEGGRLAEAGPADITVIDPNLEWRVKADDFLSRSRNSPFIDRRLKGRAVATIVKGELVYKYERG
jgi:dihydroorotase